MVYRKKIRLVSK